MPSTSYDISLGLCVYSQNVQKHYVSVSSFLEVHLVHYEILLFQEASWALIKHVPSSENAHGNPEWGALVHPDWISLVPHVPPGGKRPRAIAYMSRQLKLLKPKLWSDIIDDQVLGKVMKKWGETFTTANSNDNSTNWLLKYIIDNHM